MATFVEIAKQVAPNIGLEPPATVSSTVPNSILMGQFINETGKELVRRVDWSALTKRLTITGDGTDRRYPLANDHDRFAMGLSVTAGGAPVRGGLSADEWFSLTFSVGVPRYFRATKTDIGFYPYPADAAPVLVSYQSGHWAETEAGAGKAKLEADTDVSRLPEQLLVSGAVWRWYRYAGKDFSDYMAEFEAQLADWAMAEGGVRQP